MIQQHTQNVLVITMKVAESFRISVHLFCLDISVFINFVTLENIIIIIKCHSVFCIIWPSNVCNTAVQIKLKATQRFSEHATGNKSRDWQSRFTAYIHWVHVISFYFLNQSNFYQQNNATVAAALIFVVTPFIILI